MNQKCIIYARVSSSAQEESGYSLPAQEKLLKEYCIGKGLKVEKVFSVSESASGQKQRQVFGEMLDILKHKGVKIIVCEKVDRLTRNLRDAVKINEWINEDAEREVHFAKENWVLNRDSKSNEKFIWNIRVSVSQYYTDNLSEEVKKGQKEKIAQGWIPTKAPLGYKTVGEKGHKTHVLNEEKSLLVKKMFELYATGDYSLLKLNTLMYEMGLRTALGNRLVKSRMATILGDPFYYGMIRWNGVITKGNQEPLISKELFDLVQRTLRSKNTPKYRKHFFTFKSLIVCDKCGGRITWETHKGLVYGHCNYRYKDCTEKTWYKEHQIESQLVSILSEMKVRQSGLFEWIKKALRERHKDAINLHSSSLKDSATRVEQIQKRIDRLYDEKLDQKITPDFYDRKLREYQEEKEAILASAERHSHSDMKYHEFNEDLFQLAQRSKDIYVSMNDTDQKRALLRLIFKDIRLFEGKIVCEYTQAFKLLLEAVNFTNSKMQKMPISQEENFEPLYFRSNKTKSTPSGANIQTLLRR
jgi:site-specific DNA recombinase